MSAFVPAILFAAVVALAIVFLLRPFVSARRIGWPVLAVVASAPVTVLAIYALVGQPAALLGSSPSARVTPQSAIASGQPAPMPAGSGQKQAGSISSLVEGLAVRLAAGNGDGDDWLLLAQSYEHLGEPEKAWAAYQQALARGAHNDALAERLLFARVEPARQAAAGFRITGTLDADAEALAAIPSGATVFVIARAADGPPRPLAVARYPADTFPVRFELGAGDLMLPATEASQYASFTVYAKVSPNGEAGANVPGIASSQAETGAGATPVRLQLHRSNDG